MDKDNLNQVFQYPILKTIATRRSRRFPLGCTLPAKSLQYRSKWEPVPLNEMEMSILCWSGAGVTGSIIGDIPGEIGGNAFGSWLGSAVPYPCNVHNARLFFTNDDGTFVYNPSRTTRMVEVEGESDYDKILRQFKEGCTKILDKRVEFVPKALLGAMHWNINQPGTTVFIPVADQSEEYIDFLLSTFSVEGYGYKMWDDIKNQPAGLQKWIDAGQLTGPNVSITSFEYNVMLNNLAPGYFMLENIHLVSEAMGLGSVIFGGYTGQIMLGTTPMSHGLGFRTQKAKDGKINPVGLDGVFEAYCPPYYKNMDEAVDAVVAKKYGSGGSLSKDYAGIMPFKNWQQLQPAYTKPSKLGIDQVKAYCNYVYETYGRIPATTDTKLLPVWLQVHHLDPEFYDTYYNQGAITEAQRNHMKSWHHK